MENLSDWIEELRNSDKLIIVEGKKDKIALDYFDIKNIRCIDRKPLFEFAESIDEKDIIILTDLDKEGKKIYSFLKKQLVKKGKRIDNKFREFIFKKTELSCIEGLKTYLKNNNIFI